MSIADFEQWRKEYRPHLTEEQFVSKALRDFADLLDPKRNGSMLRTSLERLYRFKNHPTKTEAAICLLLEPPEGEIRVIAYRGEHGKGGLLESRLPSLSFANYEIAEYYALTPNNREDHPFDPRVIEAEIIIRNPIKTDWDDPFIDGGCLKDLVGTERTIQIFRQLEGYLENTDNFLTLLDDHDASDLNELLSVAGLSVLDSLYVDAFPVFDSPEYVGWFVEAGYDGVMHGGNGESALEVEYKVFSPSQVQILNVTKPSRTLARDNTPYQSPTRRI